MGGGGCHDCQKAGCDPTRGTSVARGPLLLGHRKRSLKAASSSRAAQGSEQKGMGPRKALQPQEAVMPAIETALCPDAVAGKYGPRASLPGLRDCQRSGWDELQGRPGQRSGRR